MDEIWNTLKSFAPAIALFVIVGALGYALFLAFETLASVGKGKSETTLPLLAIGGVLILVLMLTIVTAVFWWLGLTNNTQAMGLPEGSIRSVIALSLIVLFAILSVYLFENVSTGGQLNTIQNLSINERDLFLKDHPTVRDFQSRLSEKPEDSAKGLYTVTYRSANPTGDDFAKQILILLGTLMTAITSFYLGAGTATTAAAQTAAAQTAGLVKPTITNIDPTTQSIGIGSTIRLKIMGKNLNIITHVKIIRSGVQIIATEVTSNPTMVICNIPVSATAIGAAWDVVVDDGGSQSATLPAALRVRPGTLGGVAELAQHQPD
jgi:hypothetical protein